MDLGGPLAISRRPRTTLAVWTVVVAVAVGLVLWFVSSAPSLATTDKAVIASAPVGQDVYVAVVAGDPDRTLHIAGVRVHVRAEAPVVVAPLLCVGGSPRVTTDPGAFCEELAEPDGRDLGGADTLVLRVRGEHAGAVAIEQVRLAFREGLRRGTRAAGAPARITILDR